MSAVAAAAIANAAASIEDVVDVAEVVREAACGLLIRPSVCVSSAGVVRPEVAPSGIDGVLRPVRLLTVRGMRIDEGNLLDSGISVGGIG